MTPTKTIALVDYGMGNLRSVAKAWEHVGARVRIVTHPDAIADAQALVLPGVGALGDCMAALKSTGFDRAVRDWIAADKPFFGICLGMQALFEHSEEGDVEGLGILPGQVLRFRLPPTFKVPHMGWNSVRWVRRTPVDAGLDPRNDQFYFVHSYHVETPDPAIVWGACEYGHEFTCAVNSGNCYATQFHPEKSQDKGLALYKNFIARCC